MLVKCPSCTTTYRISDDLLKGTKPAFRCSRCKHIFDLEPPSAPSAIPPPAELASDVNGTENELAFTFAPGEEKVGIAETHEVAGEDAAIGPVTTKASDEEGRKDVSRPARAAKEPRRVTREAGKYPVGRKSDYPDTDATPAEEKLHERGLPPPQSNVSVLDPHRDQQASTLPYLTLFGLLTLFFSLTAAFQYTYPATLERVISKVPLVGSAVLRNAHLKNGIELQALRGSYQTIQGNRDAFLITGIAMNQNSVVIREVRLAGETYSEDAKALEQQSMWIGNAISPKLIRGMTAQDIADLQRLKPLRTFEIPPGDSVPFTIVFLKSPKSVENFICTVLAAEGEV